MTDATAPNAEEVNGRRIAVSGAGGLIGKAVCRLLEERGDSVTPLVRPGTRRQGIPWDPMAGELDPRDLAGFDAVVHLAGESIAGLWTDAKKRRILESRQQGTALVAGALAQLEPAPDLICASAIGFYGDRGDQTLDEAGSLGTGFLAEVCEVWERAAQPAKDAGARVVHLRFGVVLSRDGGALAQMLTPFKMGVGGRVGSGRQWMSWIHLQDAARAVIWAVDRKDVQGPVNVVAPEPVRNGNFTRALGNAIRRPTWIPLPTFAVNTAMGEMGRELLLASTRVEPSVLNDRGFDFEFTKLDAALEDLL